MNKINEMDVKTQKLRKDIEIVAEWRKLGKAFTSEQETFASRVVDTMLTLKIGKQMGAHLISADNVAFLKKYEARTAQSGELSTAPTDKIKTAPRVSEGLKDVAVEVASQPNQPKKSPSIENIKLTPPKNQKDGVVSSTATAKVPAKAIGSDDKEAKQVENIGHNPQLPMPTKIAEELVQNAKWGVKVGAYTNEADGIDSQLTRKDYQEFIDTPEKLKSVKAYLTTVSATLEDPKKQV